jgi:hypothetical protein
VSAACTLRLFIENIIKREKNSVFIIQIICSNNNNKNG